MKKKSFQPVFVILLVVLMELALIWALGIAPTERQQGDVQRIFYFHLGSIWPGFLAFFFVMYNSIRYLLSRDTIWDQKALISGQIGLTFCTIVLITGPIWAKPTWGVWWSWDARLTSMLMLWLIFLGYVMLRDYIDDESKRARLSAVLGIIGGSMVPFVYFSTRWFETQHPAPVIAGGDDSGIKDPHMIIALLLALTAFSFLYYVLWKRGMEMMRIESRCQTAKIRLNAMEEDRL